MCAHPEVSVKLIGRDGNAFAIIGAVRRALHQAGLNDEATKFVQDAYACGSYDELLQLVTDPVEVS